MTPDIRKKIKELEEGPETAQRELFNVAFKVFHNREEQEREDLKKRDQEKYLMLAKALLGFTSQGSKPTQKGRPTQPHQVPALNANSMDIGQDNAQIGDSLLALVQTAN